MRSEAWYSNSKAIVNRLELGVIHGNARCTLWSYSPVLSCWACITPLQVRIIVLQEYQTYIVQRVHARTNDEVIGTSHDESETSKDNNHRNES